MWPILYRFRDKRWFQSKIAIFFHPVYFRPRWRGSLVIGIGARSQKTRMMGLPDGQKIKICLSYVYPFRHNTGVWQTDGRTDTARRQRPRYAERRAGKKLKTKLESHALINCSENVMFACVILTSKMFQSICIGGLGIFYLLQGALEVMFLPLSVYSSAGENCRRTLMKFFEGRNV